MNKNEEFEYEYDEERFIELEDEEGNVEKFVHIGTIPYKGEWYAFFQIAEPSEEDEEDEVVMFHIAKDEEGELLETMEDETLMDEVFAEFCHQYENYEDSDEAMRLDS